MRDKEPKSVLAALRSCRFFENIDEETLMMIRPTARRIHQPKNSVIFEEGDVCRGLYIVEKGVVKIYKESPDAKEHVLHLAVDGDPFGEAALFHGTGYPASAAAVQATDIILLAKDEFMRLLMEHPKVSLRLMASMATWAHRLVSSIESLTLKDAGARFAAFLLSRTTSEDTHDGVVVELGMPKQTLASHLGMTGETLSRLLAKFEAEGLITSRGKRIALRSVEDLRELSEFGAV